MKRSALLTFLTFTVLAACVKDEAKPAIQFKDNQTPSFEFADAPGSLTMEFTSKLEWTASVSEAWVILDLTSGPAGDATVTVSVEANDSDKDRTAWITILSESRAATLNKTLKVTQTKHDKSHDNPHGDNPTGDISSTPFTQNCSSIGTYSGTNSKAPVCTSYFDRYQHAYGKDASSHYFRYVDFDKGEFSIITVLAEERNLGSTYKVSTGVSDNGDVRTASSSNLTLICSRDGLAWFEDKTNWTGIIIPVE